MSGPVKLILTILAAVVVCYFVLKLVAAIIVPLAIISGVGLVLYSVVYKKSLSGGRRTLP